MNNFCWLALYYTSLLGLICVVLSAFFVSSSPTTKINPSEQGSNKNHWKGFIIATVIQAKFFFRQKTGPTHAQYNELKSLLKEHFHFHTHVFHIFHHMSTTNPEFEVTNLFHSFLFFIFYEVLGIFFKK